ncbi:hypothetical protein [Nocardia abscessus]|uniref:hypothetical protein n=1 Tax=Nocardia abscessus TaxID=120957 RepID=UPI0024555553|nr:hypothetical protein [Nocardia abscessus]
MAAALVSASCTRTEVEPPPSPTLADFCEPLRNVLDSEEITPDAKIERTSHWLGKKIKDVNDVQMTCWYKSSDRDTTTAMSILSPVKGDFDLEATNKALTNPPNGMRFLDGHSAPIWFEDHRQIGEMPQKGVTAELITIVGKWRGYITINGGTDPLPISDEQVARLADVLIEATRKTNEPPDGQK